MLIITEGKKLEEYEVCVCPYPPFPGVSEILDSVAPDRVNLEDTWVK